MTHKLRLEHRTVEGILSSVMGGALIGAVIQKSWVLAIISALVGVVLLIVEKRDLEVEDEPVPVVVKEFTLTDEVLSALRQTSAKKFAAGSDPTYADGLSDGSVITSRFVLGVEDENNA